MRDKSIKLITTFLVLFFLSSILNFPTTDIRKNENFQINIKENKPKTSEFWVLTGSPIFIDDSDPSKNWSYTASHYDWCSGSGNWTDPYVIENVTIDGQGLGSCIEIANSSVYFIIKKCTTYNSGTDPSNAGIYLIQTDNGIILDNNCSNNNSRGFLLGVGGNNTLSGNIASNNRRDGFVLGVGGNNTLLGNIANNNSRGFVLGGSSNNTFLGNIANNNSQGFYLGMGGNNMFKGNIMNLGGISTYGSINEMTSQNIDNSNLLNNKPIYYYGNEIGLKPNDFLNAGQIILINCNDSIISGVNISNCYHGIYLDYSNNNTIEDNIVNNNINNGITMENSFDNILAKNNVNFNSKYGIYFSCSNITLWNNTANNNQESGIYASGDNNFVIENEANNNNQGGIKIAGDNNTILDNRAFNNINNYGIYMFGLHNNASRNTMKNCGIAAAGPLEWRNTCLIDDSNTVNEKPVYFYNNEIGLNSYNFSNAGQVQLNNCSNSVISNLNISNTTIGISIFFSNNNTISGNIANNNYYFGIVFNGDNNTVSGNILNNNKDSGLIFDGNNNQLIGNTMCCNNRYGIYPMMSCDFNLFVENNISKNGETGILLTPSSNDNLFYKNIFDDNGLNAEDRGFNNEWDNGIIGNYWGDYSGTDLNNDGIGDSPYNIFGTANSQDNFPILDINPPKITINYPSSYGIFGSNAPDFNVEIIEPHIDKMWYTINNGATNIFFTLNGTINQALWDALPEGNVTFRFYANDSIGNIGFQEVTVVKEITQTSPLVIPGYNLLFLLGIISTVAVIIVKKRVNHIITSSHTRNSIYTNS